ncbi:MAG: BON domain-containing protein [Nitrosospira sp.]
MKQLKSTFIAIAAILSLSISGCASTSTTESTGEYIDDSVITTKVKAAIFNEPGLESTEISVKTFKGIVQLSGFVSRQADISRAMEIAKTIEGAKFVRNSLYVK